MTLIIPLFFFSCKGGKENKNNLKASDTLVYTCIFDSINEIKYDPEVKGIALPARLIIGPGIYNINSFSFNAEREGLLRILLIGRCNYQRIVFEQDTLALLSALSWITTHGNLDKQQSNEELTKKALTDKLYLTCGPESKWAASILESLDINCREVMTLTLEPWNNYDNGHNLIEVKWGGKWVLFDIDNNSYFTSHGKYLNLIQFRECVKSDDYEILKLSDDIPVQSAWLDDAKKYDFTFYAELRLIALENLKKWYQRIIDVVFIESDGIMYFPAYSKNELNKRILNYPGKIQMMDSTRFLKFFYSAE